VGDNDYASTRTLVTAYQMIKPKEYARAHRHSPNALRLVLDAEPGLFTVVNGIKLPMKSGDVLLTPSWCWHSHYNEGAQNAYWIDVLDVPLVHLLEPMFYEEFPGGYQPAETEPAESPFWYPLAWVEAELAKTTPLNGGGIRRLVLPSQPHIPTMELSHLALPRGASTGPDRTTANRIFAVVRGQGVSQIGGLRAEWKRGDVFVVPTWAPFEITASEDALIFQANDEPVQRMLGFFRRATQA
jgi:gentisate 1,2-dioxygenase